ncbi:non-ribosomal peptide synthetase [Microbacterium amylolyticum]|uniref:Bacitracin synthase 3/lichenysin synthetase B n=1 Tax=Microbacterium amylolyticum TaxID=936337 RepID=A0ABS4ZHM8_9MICO|nr:non-ribosomal peptide synthetase [Microbacterium amylolyticum]MBP2436782.1 bacitracin synthase 3/lichenysin synthetase B [Microbacterium amylolyticum]
MTDTAAPAVESINRLTAMQKGMYFSTVRDPDSDAYIEQFDFTLVGTLPLDALHQALAATCAHFAVLRTAISYRNTDDPFQVVMRERTMPVEVVDLRRDGDALSRLDDVKAADRFRGFDLAADPLMRATVLLVDDDTTHLLLTFHHIVLDGWSLGPLFATLFEYLGEAQERGEIIQRREEHPFGRYIDWCQSVPSADAEHFWAERLSGYERKTLIPVDAAVSVDATVTRMHTVQLGSEVVSAMARASREWRVSASTIFHAAWGVLLQKVAYSDDVVFGSVVSGRAVPVEGIEHMVGLFVNTSPVRVTSTADANFEQMCRAVHEDSRLATAHAHHPLYEVAALVPGAGELIDHVLAFENYPPVESFMSDDDDERLRVTGLDVFERTPYALHVVVNPGDTPTVTFTYDEARLPQERVQMLADGLVRILTIALDQPALALDEIALVEASNVDIHEGIIDSTILEDFARWVQSTPEAIALDAGPDSLSYRELDDRARRIATEVESAAAGSDAPVGVLVGRSPNLVAALLGVLMSGRAYLPLDGKDPDSRIATILRDAEAVVVCVDHDRASRIPTDLRLLSVDVQKLGTSAVITRIPTPDAPAYVMYTSGSTGTPKGCIITHRNVVRLVTDQSYFDFTPAQRILHTSSPAFDAFTFEMWGALLSGATLVFADEMDVLDGNRLRSVIAERAITAMWLTVGLFNQLADLDPALFVDLDHLLIGGSALAPRQVERVQAACPGLRITNGYGPTENTTFSTTHEITPDDLRGGPIPIGRPLAHSSAFVVDRGLNLLPPGALGELCVGGAGVAAGYLQRPELTAERFISLAAVGSARVYRTGDLVRSRADGTLVYLGRADDQVKINGYRVEIGEVERALTAVAGVSTAAVLAIETAGALRLAGFFTTHGDLAPAEVRRLLGAALPAYLVPSSIDRVDTIPLTRNGKVDRAQLLAAVTTEPSTTPVPVTAAPGSSGAVLAQIFADVLEVASVDVQANFFDLGLNSLTLLTVNNRIRAELGVELAVTELFEHTTVRALDERIVRLTTPNATESADDVDDDASLVAAPSMLNRLALDLEEED